MGASSWGGKVDCVTGLEGLQAGHEKKNMSRCLRQPALAQHKSSRGVAKGLPKGLPKTCWTKADLQRSALLFTCPAVACRAALICTAAMQRARR